MRKFEPRLLPMAVGSVPHADPEVALRLIYRLFPEIPCWPQLPKRAFAENMYAQFSERFPAVTLEGDRVVVRRSQDLDPELERLYVAYLRGDPEYGAISPEYAAGLAAMTGGPPQGALAVKGQVTGPVSWGLVVVDEGRRPILYDEVLAEAVAKHLRLKATWQEEQLKRFAHTVITFIDEPYMSSFGSAYVSLSREQALVLIEEVLAGIQGVKGVHCCGNTDWSVLTATSVDLLNFDAYEYVETVALYVDEIRAFLGRGGILAWGVVPSSAKIHSETAEGLADRLVDGMQLFVSKGIPFDRLLEASMVTPSCGTGSLDIPTAEKVLTTTGEVSRIMRQRYGVS